MRKLKFRAWDGSHMHYDTMPYATVAEITLCIGSRGYNSNTYEITTNIDCTANEVMQFTGLKDKNGVEIYEGDIVYLKHETGYETWDESKEVIKFELGYFSCSMYTDHSSICDCEVIGNIHENGDLLWKGLGRNINVYFLQQTQDRLRDKQTESECHLNVLESTVRRFKEGIISMADLFRWQYFKDHYVQNVIWR